MLLMSKVTSFELIGNKNPLDVHTHNTMHSISAIMLALVIIMLVLKYLLFLSSTSKLSSSSDISELFKTRKNMANNAAYDMHTIESIIVNCCLYNTMSFELGYPFGNLSLFKFTNPMLLNVI
eukprot:NODE_19_length_39463_cov_0.396073.p23 type:complete len:122 gc:universal NODE_19_length_39463_cov_0.396073:24421-24786(+)